MTTAVRVGASADMTTAGARLRHRGFRRTGHPHANAGVRAFRPVAPGFGIVKTLQGALASALMVLLLNVFPLTRAVFAFVPDTKTAAYSGVIFALAVLVILALIKLWQRFSPSPSSSCPKAPCDFDGAASDSRPDSSPAQPVYRRHIPSRRP